MVTRPQTTERRAKGSGPEADADGGRAAAFEAAVLVHLNAAYTLARYLTRRSPSAEDIVQDALLRAYRSFDSQRGDNVRAWLLAIVRNCFLTWKARDGERSGDWSFDDEGELASKAGEDGQDNENPELISYFSMKRTARSVRLSRGFLISSARFLCSGISRICLTAKSPTLQAFPSAR